MTQIKNTVRHLNRLDAEFPVYAHGLTFSPDNHYLLVGGFQRDSAGVNKGMVRVLQMPNGKAVRQFPVEAWVDTVLWSPNLQTIGAGCGQATLTDTAGSEILFWNVTTAKMLRRIELQKFTLRSAAISPNGSLLAVGGVHEEGKRFGEVRLLEFRTGKQVSVLTHGDQVWSVVFSPDGKIVASGSGTAAQDDWKNTDIRLWDVKAQTELRTLRRPHGQAQSSAVFSPDGTLITSGDGPEGDVLLWETQTGKLRSVFKGHSGPVYALAFSPDGKWLVTGSRDSTVRFWDVSSGECAAITKKHKTAVHAVCFSSEGKWAASGDIQSTIHLWQID